LALLLLAGRPSHAQRAGGTISGTVQDSQHAVVPNAQVILENSATKDRRIITTNSSGFFNFAAVPVGTYSVSVKAPGFQPYVATDITIHAGDDRVLPDLLLQVSGSTSVVQVTASEAGVIPLDNGASSTTINETLVQNLSIQGRDAAELVKFMPGLAMNTGLGQTEFNSQTTQTNSGPIGAFSANGTQPYGSMQMTLDGAGLIDVGNQGTQIANVNQDQTAEFTYLNAAFGADTPRGPNIIQVTSKGGGQQFHGDAYAYLRNWQLNANDPYNKAVSPGIRRVISHQTYPGGTIGGPVIFPGFGYNRNRDKLFFFAGYEKMFQNPEANLVQLVVPTTNMINGDFSNLSKDPNAWNTAQQPCVNAPSWTGFCPGGKNPFPGGIIPASYWDQDGRNLLMYMNKINPPNIDPATHNGYNFQFLDHEPVNRWELRLRGDWDPTLNDKFSVVYTKQNEADINNFGIWWWPSWTAPMPSQLNATTKANLWTANYVHVFSPTTTNEFSFAYTYFTFPPKFKNPAAMTAATANYTTYAPFDTSSTNAFDQLPNILSWQASTGAYSGSFAGIYAPPMIKGFGGAYGNIKKIYAYQDNFTKVLGRHSLKAGFFWDSNNQTQTTGYGNWTQGAIEFDPWGYYTTNNQYADMLIGHTAGMSQYAAAPVHDMAYHEWAFYGQDQWHVTNKFTLNYGVRFDHEGAWYPTRGPGLAVFDPSSYDNTPNAPTWTGMKWHQIDSKIPQSGFVSPFVQPDVRFGGAYDVHGNGRTVVRGGFGIYRWQFSEGDVDAALNPAWNVLSISTPATESFAALASYKPTASSTWCALNSTCPTGVDAIKKGENKTPYTMNWDAMVDQELPNRMVFELQYIGNHTDNALFTGNGTTESFISNINKIPIGGLYGTNALTGINYWQQSCAQGSCATPNSQYYNGYRPYANYGVLNLVQHGSYSNYNGMVVALQKQTGMATFIVNYTFSKVMGIRDGQTDNGGGDGVTIDPFHVRANYGPLAYDRTHLFNAAYYITLPGLHDANFFVKGIINGWQLSGDTQLQSGTPLQPNTGGNLNAKWLSNSSGASASNTYLLGTNAVVLSPYLKCDPRSGGGKYFNPSCFQTPSKMGVNGPAVWPYIKGPAFFVSDLAIAKSFAVTEHQNIQLRVSAFNFLNHPLPQLGQGNDDNLYMNCVQSSPSAMGCDEGGTNQNPTTNGNVQYKAAKQHRYMELSLKYNF
jgi:hypothetical protein